MTINLTTQDETTLRTAAYGAVTLLAAADATGKPHKIATQGSIALASATGPIGHILADHPKAADLGGKSVAEIADNVLPALTNAMTLLKEQDPTQAANFRSTVLVAVEAATHALETQPGPVLTETIRKITAALDTA